MRTRWLITTVLPVLASSAKADLTPRWIHHHDGPESQDDYGYLSCVDSKGSLLVCGATTNALGVTEILTVKFDANGTEQWARTYASPGGGPDYAFAIAVDAQGDVIVLGDSVGVGTDYDLVTLKYTPAGDLAWAQRYDGPASGYDGTSGGINLAVDAGGHVFVGGYSQGLGTSYDSVVLKYSPAGALEWEARYDGPTHGVDYCYGLALDSAGNVCVTGETPAPSGTGDYLALEYDTNGNLLWQQQYDGPAHGGDYVYMLAVGPSDEIVMTGSSAGGSSRDDVATVAFDADGNLLWARRYDGPQGNADVGFAVAVSGQGRVAVAGRVVNTYDSAALLLCYDQDGTPLWSRTGDLSALYYGDDAAVDVAFDASENVYVVGSGWNGAESGHDLYLARYSPAGDPTFEWVYDGPVHADDLATRVVVRGDEVYVSGLSQRGSTHLDVFAMKFGPELPFTSVPMALEIGGSLPSPFQAQPSRSLAKVTKPSAPRTLRPRSRLPLDSTRAR